MSELIVTSTGATDYEAVLNLLFEGFPAAERAAVVKQARRLLAQRELDSSGLLAAYSQGKLVGAMLAVATHGAVGLVWPPQIAQVPDFATVEDALIQATHQRLKKQGVKLTQALLLPREIALGTSLARNGYRHITRLLFHRRWLDDVPTDDLARSTALALHQFTVVDRQLFTSTLQRTYAGTLDCPELEGVRTIDEVIAGYQAQAEHDPCRWWLASLYREPVGVVLANATTEESAWEIVYVGIVPECRGHGLGGAVVQHVLIEAKLAGMQVVTLSVDRRNTPAIQLYRRLGFTVWDEREVFLAIF